jgi:hypothetical protein
LFPYALAKVILHRVLANQKGSETMSKQNPASASSRPTVAPSAAKPTAAPTVAKPSPKDEAIRMCAYRKWEAAGRPSSDGVRFWLDAEKELAQAK